MKTALGLPTDRLDDVELAFIEKFRRHGWMTTTVGARRDFPAFSYSTGLWLQFGHPEIIMLGLSQAVSHQVFHNIFRAASEGTSLQSGVINTDLFENLPCFVLDVPHAFANRLMGWSHWFYLEYDFPCLQIVWSDPDGRFPWMQSFALEFRDQQIDLSLEGWAKFGDIS